MGDLHNSVRNGNVSKCLVSLSGIHHTSDPIRIRNKPERSVKPENSGLRIESNVGDAFLQQLLQQPLHHRLPQPYPLERRLHHHVPYDRVEYSVPRRPRERHRPLRLPVLNPQHRLRVLQRHSDLLRVTLREPYGHEYGIQVV